MFKKYAPYILAGVLLIVGLAIGFLLGQSQKTPGQNSQETVTSEQQPIPKSNNLYSYQTASLMGVILKRDDNLLTIKNLNSSKEGVVEASPRLVISSITNNRTSNASPSSDLSSIQFNKDAQINLELVNGAYQVISIQYIPPPPSLPPIPSSTKNP